VGGGGRKGVWGSFFPPRKLTSVIDKKRGSVSLVGGRPPTIEALEKGGGFHLFEFRGVAPGSLKKGEKDALRKSGGVVDVKKRVNTNTISGEGGKIYPIRGGGPILHKKDCRLFGGGRKGRKMFLQSLICESKKGEK